MTSNRLSRDSSLAYFSYWGKQGRGWASRYAIEGKQSGSLLSAMDSCFPGCVKTPKIQNRPKNYHWHGKYPPFLLFSVIPFFFRHSGESRNPAQIQRGTRTLQNRSPSLGAARPCTASGSTQEPPDRLVQGPRIRQPSFPAIILVPCRLGREAKVTPAPGSRPRLEPGMQSAPSRSRRRIQGTWP